MCVIRHSGDAKICVPFTKYELWSAVAKSIGAITVRLGNELKIGITIVLAVLIGFIGFRVMKDAPIFRFGTVYYADYNRVDGLSVGTSVLLSGIKIGSVQQLQLIDGDSVRVTLSLNIRDGLPKGSVAVIRSVDLLGSKGIEIRRGGGNEMIPYGGKLEGLYDDGMFAELADAGSGIAENVKASTGKLNTLLSEIQTILEEGGRENISSTLGNLERTTVQVEALITESRSDITTSLDHLRGMLANLEELTSEERGELQRIIANLESASDELQTMSVSLTEVSANLADITRKINEGEGTLGRMVNDPSLYENLDSLSVNLNRMVQELNENPRHFLRHIRLIDIF